MTTAAPVGKPSSALEFYRYPDLYFALRSPTRQQLDAAWQMMRTHLDGEPRSVLDPACGPATWLLPFAQSGLFVAGNDLFPEMVEWAGRVLADYPHELRKGDMCALDFQQGPFDVAFELSGTSGHLLDDDAFTAHLRTMARHIRPGGLVMLLVFIDYGGQLATPTVTGRNGPLPIPGGGSGTITYEILSQDRQRLTDLMRRTIEAEGVPNCPGRFVDEYELRSHSPDKLRALIAQVPELELAAVYDLDEAQGLTQVELVEPYTEVSLVMRVK